jgi:hypothetical protein
VTDDQKNPEQIRADIEETRHELGETAAALAAKTDVKARAKEKVEGAKQTIAAKKESFGGSGDGDGTGGTAQASAAATQVKAKARENPIPAAAIAAFAGGFLLGRITSR